MRAPGCELCGQRDWGDKTPGPSRAQAWPAGPKLGPQPALPSCMDSRSWGTSGQASPVHQGSSWAWSPLGQHLAPVPALPAPPIPAGAPQPSLPSPEPCWGPVLDTPYKGGERPGPERKWGCSSNPSSPGAGLTHGGGLAPLPPGGTTAVVSNSVAEKAPGWGGRAGHPQLGGCAPGKSRPILPPPPPASEAGPG